MQRKLLIAAIAAISILYAMFGTAHADSYCSGGDHSREALTAPTRSTLEGLEAHLGTKVQIVGTCVIKHRAGDRKGRMSEHAFGRAVDLKVSTKLKAKAVAWLRQNATGAVLTYLDSSHIHFDMGRWHGYRTGQACFCTGERRVRTAKKRGHTRVAHLATRD